MPRDRFDTFCIVGAGGHARTKLIPAIEANGQKLAAVVSGKGANAFPGVVVYPRLAQAIAELPRETAFFVATPPALHFTQAKQILQGGFDLFLEKPAFVSRKEAAEITSLCAEQALVLVEGFMHRHTRLNSELLATWAASRDAVSRIEIEFLIDRIPPGTFRSEASVVSSGLFDIGCYPVSLLADIGLGDARLEIAEVRFAGDPERMRIRVTGSAGAIAVGFDIGIGAAYANTLRLHLNNGDSIGFAPFFYGRKGERSITTSSAGKSEVRTLMDDNAFEVMLARPRSAWLRDQAERSRQMVEVASRLETLARAL